MNADELRQLADALEPMAPAPRFSGIDVPAACAYLRACADALDAGPVAWRAPLGAGFVYWTDYENIPAPFLPPINNPQELYPVALPAPLRMPEPMTDDEICAAANCAGTFKFARAIEAETLRRVKEANE